MTERITQSFLLLWILLLVTACNSYEDLAKKRVRQAQAADGDIRIAVVWQKKLVHTHFFEGAQLAVDEVNEKDGINGRKLRMLRYYNDAASVEKDRQLAKHISADGRIAAVIGHYTDRGATAASVTYEYNGLPYISSEATNVGFSQHGFQLVFRNTLSDGVNGTQLADFAKKRGYSKMVVIDDRMVYGKGLADIFHARASKIGIDIVARRSYDSLGEDFKPLFAEIKNFTFDAIFLGGSMPSAGEVIRQSRLMGVTAPFMGGTSLDVPTLWQIAGQAAEGTITPTVFHWAENSPASRAFTGKFSAKYNTYPDTWAALGYDAVQLLTDAFRQTGTTIPMVVASYLRFLEDRPGVLGTYSFLINGDISGDINMFQILHNGRFELLEDTLP